MKTIYRSKGLTLFVDYFTQLKERARIIWGWI